MAGQKRLQLLEEVTGSKEARGDFFNEFSTGLHGDLGGLKDFWFSSTSLGKWFPIWRANIFQMCWEKTHQPVIHSDGKIVVIWRWMWSFDPGGEEGNFLFWQNRCEDWGWWIFNVVFLGDKTISRIECGILKRRMQSACKWLMWNRTNKWSYGPLLQELFLVVSLCRFRLWLQIFQRVHSLEQLLGKLDLDAVKEARGLMDGGWVVGHWPVWFQLPTTVWGPPLCCKWDNDLMPLKLA